jgi:hypothetical protein
MSVIKLGIVYKPYPLEFAELQVALSEITKETSEEEDLIGLAGPNDVVQILIDALTWHKAIIFVAIIFGRKFVESFATELGKHTEAYFWKEKKNYSDAITQAIASPFIRVVNAIKTLRSKNQTITIAIKIQGTCRNAGLVLKSEDPAEIAWEMANVIRNAEKIQNIVIEAQRANPDNPIWSGDNPDKSIEVEILENGDIKVLGITISD